MRARFIGDPLNGGHGPQVLEAYGFQFPKGEWVDVPELPRIRASNHFEVEEDAAPVLLQLDHDGDGKPGGSLSKAEVKARLTELAVDFDPSAPVKELRELLEVAEAVTAPVAEGETEEA